MRISSIIAFFIVSLGSAAHSQEIIRAASFGPQGTPVGQALEVFSETLQSCSNGSIEVEVFSGGTLGSPIDIPNLIQLGTIDVAILPSFALQQLSSAARIISAPLVFNNRRHWESALDGPVLEALDVELTAAAGLRVLGYMGGEQYGLLSTSPITTPQDIIGRTIRTANIDATTFEALGAKPVPMAFAEAFTALQTGLVDTTEISASSALQSKFYEVASEFVTTNHRIFTDLMVMSQSSIEGLNDETRLCLTEAVETASEAGRNAVASLESTALLELAELGVTVRPIENRPALFEQASEVTRRLVSAQGADEIYDLILSSFTCPAWCDDSTCGDDECKACQVCESQ